MNVVALSLSYPPARRIGAELALHHLLAHLASRGHDVQVVTQMLTGRRMVDGVKVSSVGARRPHGDVVIVNAGLGKKARLWWPRTPMVVWAHNNQLPTILDARAGKPDLLLSNTTHMSDVYRSVIGLPSLVLHPHTPPSVPCLTGDAVTLVNCTPDKGSAVFWDLAEQNPHVPFVAVRGGYGPQDIRDLPNVDVVDHGDLDAVWARTRVLLLPSRHESYSMTAAEAITRGIPVVAADLPGVREACGYGAVYTTDQWGPALTDALGRWDELSTNALIHAATRRPDEEMAAVVDVIEAFRITERAA
ncbi:MAG: glycosyltransferase [Cellulomonas sp.]|nr:glycosyltransferase [Cellulomonas sp.]MCR6649728.1 glycosyltransferase [Cellulomonas sp.]